MICFPYPNYTAILEGRLYYLTIFSYFTQIYPSCYHRMLMV